MSDADLAAQRRVLRQDLRARRRELPASARLSAAQGVALQLLSLPSAPRAGYVAGYWAMDGEIALHAFQLRLPRDCVYCLPVLGEDKRLRFAPWRPGAPLISNRYGIPEPDVSPSSLLEAEALSLVVVPLVGFDAQGHRLGMGGGWYDRTFAFRRERPAPPLLVGAAFALQQMPHFAPAPWDVNLDAVCTESSVFDFTTAPA